MTSALISAAELHAALGRPDLRVLDATYGPARTEGIPGAVDFDIDDIADPHAPLAHTAPSPEIFAAKAGALGVGNDSMVVVYDAAGMASAASRAWWMFRLYGHDNVRVLDGGLPAWTGAGYPLARKDEAPAAFRPAFRSHLIKYRDQIAGNLTQQAFTVIDARDAARYAGADTKRPELAQGHIPGSRNLFFRDLIDPATGRLKPRGELRALLSAVVEKDKPVAASCGSGVTACVVALALREAGMGDAAVYDGSWAEWGADPALPKTTGENP